MMFEILNSIFSVSDFTIHLIVGLTIACSWLFLYMTKSWVLTLLFTPIAALGALSGIYVSRELGLYYSTDSSSNLMMSGILGLIISLAIVIVTARIGYFLIHTLRNWQRTKLGMTK